MYLAGLKQGATVPMLALPGTVTNSQGIYHVQVPWDSLPAKYFDSLGGVDLTLSADNGKPAADWELPALPPTGSIQIASSSQSSHRFVSPTTAVPGKSAARIDFELGTHPKVYDARSATLKTIAKMSGIGKDGRISISTVPSRRSRANSDGNAHTLGIAYKAGTGDWTQNGTNTLSESSSTMLGNRVNLRDFETSCGGAPAVNVRKAISTFAQLSDFKFAPHPSYPEANCSPIYHSGTFYKSSGKNSTYSAGLDAGPISVSAQAGWNSDTKLTWKVNKPSRFCGSTSSGPAASPRAEMHKA